MKRLSANKQKILLLLLGGVALGLASSPIGQRRILKAVSKEWKRVNRERLQADIRELYHSKLVSTKQNPDKSVTLVLTEKGKLRAFTYKFENMEVSKKNWDGLWRIVVFDIPEDIRRGRDALRKKLRALGFYELQKSVFVFPYECRNEVEFIIEFFGLRKFVRYGVLSEIDNDLHLRKIFRLL